MDKLRLIHEQLIFKWTSNIDPNIENLEILASINAEKVTLDVVTMVTEQLRNTIPFMRWISLVKRPMSPVQIGLRPERYPQLILM